VIAEVKCDKCRAECCRNSVIPLNIIDLKKILYHVKEYNAVDVDSRFKVIEHNGKPLVAINDPSEGLPQIYLASPCAFLNEDNLCSLHKLQVKDKEFAEYLDTLELSRDIKPLACRAHPYFFDNNEGISRWADCRNTKSSFPVEDKNLEWIVHEKDICTVLQKNQKLF